MGIFKIKGGIPLKGHFRAVGAKNAITKLLVASLISEKRYLFFNVPNILDVEITVGLCKEIGSIVNWDTKERVIEISTPCLKTTYIPQRFSGSNRIPILMIGALLGRTDEDIIVPMAGGCKIGRRPVDFHIKSLEKLGASIEYREMKKEGAYFARAHEGLQGCLIELPYPSVGATENTILAACRAKGTTVIKNAAIEPEVIDLVLFLQKLGVAIVVDVDRTIRIQPAQEFYEVEHTVVTDRIEVASLAMAAIGTKGHIFIEGAQHLHMIAFLNKLRELGAGFHIRNNGIEFFYRGALKGGILLETDVHPGFLTDWQQPFVALLTQAEGHSIVHETVHENRFGYTETLKEMGADIQIFNECLGNLPCRFRARNYAHSIVIKGVTPLVSKAIAIPDLRAGFAYVIAALMAPDETILSGIHFLDRGYEDLAMKLASLGADINHEPKSKKKETASNTTLTTTHTHS